MSSGITLGLAALVKVGDAAALAFFVAALVGWAALVAAGSCTGDRKLAVL